MSRRVEELSSDIKKQVISRFEEFQFFSVAVDESTDAKDTAQLAIFVRGINSNFDICEEFLQLVSLKDTTYWQRYF